MGRQEVWKECKFCGIRFGQDTSKCPKCGSSNAKLVMPKEMEADRVFFAEEKVRKEKEQAEKQAKKKKAVKKWKKAFRIIGIILAILLVLCIVGSILIGCWAMWMNRKEAEKWPEDTESAESIATNINIYETQEPIREEELSDEEWLEYVLPILDEWYAQNADEEILKIHKKAMDDNRPIYMWDHYMYGATLYEFSIMEDIWKTEQTGVVLRDYENSVLLNYYLMYWDFEDSYTYTDEEKVWLQKYVDKLREDVKWRFGLSESGWEELYADVTAEQGYIDYEKVKAFVKNSAAWGASAVKATETMDDDAWKNTMFPILDKLFREGKEQQIALIYHNTEQIHQGNSRPFEKWSHNKYIDCMRAMWGMEYYWQEIDAGKRLSEHDYVSLVNKYLWYKDCPDKYGFTTEEEERITPYLEKMDEYVTSLWDFSQGEWKELLEKSKKEYIGDDAEKLVHKWLQEIDREKQADEPEISE